MATIKTDAPEPRPGADQYHCDICGRIFTTPQGLGSHKQRTHGVKGGSPAAVRRQQGEAEWREEARRTAVVEQPRWGGNEKHEKPNVPKAEPTDKPEASPPDEDAPVPKHQSLFTDRRDEFLEAIDQEIRAKILSGTDDIDLSPLAVLYFKVKHTI